MPEVNKNNVSPSDSLKFFQLTTESIKDKSSREYGMALMKYVAQTASFNTGGYYFVRNARFIKNRNYANGTIDIQAMFQDRFQFNGKQNYIALNWNALQIVNRIISGLVGRWMGKNEKIQVKAIDDLSLTDKEAQYQELEVMIEQRKKLEELQAKSGVQIMPQWEIPEDKESLNLWKVQFQRLPEEIQMELIDNEVLASNGWYDVLKEKLLHDAAEVLFVGTYTWMDSNGIVHVRRVKPENAIYSFSEENDLRDTTWRGEAPTVKISEIRRQWGKEFNPDNPFALTEKEIWEKIIPTCKEFTYQSNIGSWNDMWLNAFVRPYDEWNVRSMQVEIKTVDSEPYTVTKTKNTGTTYTQKGYPKTINGNQKEKPSVNQNIIGDTNWNIYRGVYLQDCDLLLEWGLKDNMITPQDPREIGNADFSYSYVMPQNYMMRNLAIPEKIEAAVDGMILACLKVQQDVSTAVPPGWVIDETAWQSVDFGLGEEGNNAVDKSKLFFQTGKIYYRGLDAEGNRVPVPVQEIQNTGFYNHIDAFIRTYQFWYQSLKDELGEDPNLISAALQPRVTGENVQASQTNSEYATDYIYRAYSECMKQTSRKINCLAKDAIKFGAKAYRQLANKDDLDKRIFSTDVRFLPTDYEVQRFDVMMTKAMDTTPELALFIDPMQMIRVAKEDVKLAESLYRQGVKKMILWKQQTTAENTQATIDGQIKSAQEAEKSKQETETVKGNIDLQKTKMETERMGKNTLYTLIGTLMGKEQPLPPYLEPLIKAAIENDLVPLVVKNEEQKSAIINEMRQLSENQNTSPNPMTNQDQNNQQQPPPQMAA